MNRFFGRFLKPSPMKSLARVYDLKSRLDWGEPALTIIDVRSRDAFNYCHVTGAVSMPAATLTIANTGLEQDRDIYIYAETDDEATTVAEQFTAAGYERVAVLRGGVAAWKAAGFPLETTSLVTA